MKRGILLIISGLLGSIASYSYRPPADIGQIFMMVGNGQQFYLKEPIYLGIMGLSIALIFSGALLIFKSSQSQNAV